MEIYTLAFIDIWKKSFKMAAFWHYTRSTLLGYISNSFKYYALQNCFATFSTFFSKHTFLQNVKCYIWSFAKMRIYKVQSRLEEKIAKLISKNKVCKTIANIPKHHLGCVIAESIHFEAFFKKIYKCQSISFHMLYSDLIYLH